MLGVNQTEAPETLLNYVPRLALKLNRERAAGPLGEQALGGYVAFALMGAAGGESAKNTSGVARRTACYLVVMRLTGELVAVRPAPMAPMIEANVSRMGVVYYNALKMKDPRNVLLGANYAGSRGRGPSQLWDWKADVLTTLSNGSMGLGTYSSHDAQWVSKENFDEFLREHMGGNDAATGGGTDRIWRPSDDWNTVYAYDVDSADVVRTIGPLNHKQTSDMNHFQILEGGVAIVNGRMTSSFRKVDLRTSKDLWVCGGDFNNFTLVDLDGTVYSVEEGRTGGLLWSGQHNLEYFGDSEYYMFDNAFHLETNDFLHKSSRPLRVQLDETRMLANVTWAFETNVHSNIYGDADLLPTGNVLACYWPNQLNSAMREQFDARLVEVVPSRDQRGDDVAWELLVKGQQCAEPPPRGCARSSGSIPEGWSMYSSERFYMAPLVHSVSLANSSTGATVCEGRVEGANATAAARDASARPAPGSANSSLMLEFIAIDSFKKNLPAVGYWRIERAGSGIAAHTGAFRFNAHWRPKTITVELESKDLTLENLRTEAWQLVVQDQWGYENRTIPLEC